MPLQYTSFKFWADTGPIYINKVAGLKVPSEMDLIKWWMHHCNLTVYLEQYNDR